MSSVLSLPSPQSILFQPKRSPLSLPHSRSASLKPPHDRHICCSSLQTPPPVVTNEEEESPAPPSLDDVRESVADNMDAATTNRQLSGCKTCGREELETGCNGEGRIQGGIATMPGFGWWPIKAFRPCPGFVASGGRYRRRGQSMDEVVSGRGGKDASVGNTDATKSKKMGGPKQG